jgi:ribosomal protein S18 acetylase RimI-like enzyme
VVGDDSVVVRQATAADIPDLVRLRRAMFESMGLDDPALLDSADAAAEAYFASAIPAKEFFGWLAITSIGAAVGSGGVVIDQHPPGPGNLSGRVGYIMNLVTIPAYRRRGIARRVMQTMLQWLAERHIHLVTLHATEVGRPLYRELGFVDGNEMQLKASQASE